MLSSIIWYFLIVETGGSKPQLLQDNQDGLLGLRIALTIRETFSANQCRSTRRSDRQILISIAQTISGVMYKKSIANWFASSSVSGRCPPESCKLSTINNCRKDYSRRLRKYDCIHTYLHGIHTYAKYFYPFTKSFCNVENISSSSHRSFFFSQFVINWT